MGAGIAAAFAARHPARVARLVVQCLVTHTNPQMRSQNLDRAAEIERSGMRPFAKASADRSFPEVLRANRERFERHCRRWICNDPHGYAAIQRMLADMTLADELPNISCPTLSIGCVHDPLRPPAMVSELTEKIPNARYVQAESGHFMHVQSPEMFCDLAVPFLCAA
jgi:3-oxoadipate enol-lactonase